MNHTTKISDTATVPEIVSDLVRTTWPGASFKSQSASDIGAEIRRYFKINGERYAFDNKHCGMSSDWYQYDSDQDAPYYGTWINPALLAAVCYCEGDITATICGAPTQFRQWFAELEAWSKDRNGRLDDHDDKFWAKVEAIEKRDEESDEPPPGAIESLCTLCRVTCDAGSAAWQPATWALYNYFLNVLPPAYWADSVFAVGEANHHDDNGRAVYLCFRRNPANRKQFEARYATVADLKREASA